jgi:hypothetical protein
MDVFVVRCVLGDLDAMAIVEVSVRLISRRRGGQGVGARAVEGQARRPGGLAISRPAMMCGLGR